MSRFEPLLRLQDCDTRADQIRHRLAHLPERAQLDEHYELVSAHQRARAEVQARRDDLARQQRRLEDEIATVEAKAAEVNETLYGGTITSPRELQTLQQEIDSLKRRQASLEDDVLALMEQIEPLDAELADLDTRGAELDAEAQRLELVLAEAAAALDGELGGVAEERQRVLAEVEADLLELYVRLRSQLGGIAVARLVAGSCQGCHLALPAAEVERLKRLPPEELAYCEECGRLLVR
ncbi:MAG: C4-type zinc ribbon domain-containing protein [Acidimicrobiales bacterium]|nr:C4-type zinc ribbon domain-containing protein [Acidimicrobiales bacterium]